MAEYDYDLFVIGAGSGGVRAARLAANLGLRVGVAEEDRPGGTCVLRGCVPKKFMVFASEAPEQVEYAKGFGWDVTLGAFNWHKFKEHNQAELTRLSGIYGSNLARAGAELINAHAAFKDEHTITLTHGDTVRDVTAKIILIAVGGWPFMPHHCPGVTEHGLTSNDMFTMETLPKRMVIVGGGYIAVEFAGIMHGLGVDVTLMYRGEKILRGFDDDVRDHLTTEMRLRGINIMTKVDPIALAKTGADEVTLTLNNGEKFVTERVLYASGRKPKTEGLGLDNIGLTLDAGHGGIPVDAHSRTKIPHIFAIGDVTNRLQLTPVAIREAIAFIETAFKSNPTAYDYENVPTAVFSQPQIGTVGLTETQAKEKGIAYDVYETKFRMMKTAFIGMESRVLMKLIVDQKSDVVLGVHLVGGEAGELIQLAGVAVKGKLTKAQWDATCAVHPTAAEELVTLKDKRL